MAGLLIVNADDWGHERSRTEAILEAFAAARVSSTTAMVYMEDSRRAAEIAKAKDLPVGLHLNLTEAFTDPTVPAPVRERQRELIRTFFGLGRDGHPGTSRRRRWMYDPLIARQVGDALRDQVEHFEALYGRPPTHFDGHNYVDTSPNVFLSRALPRGAKMRNSLDCYPLAKGAMAIARGLRQVVRTWRFTTTRCVLQIADLDLPDDPRLALAVTSPVEVICHPHEPEEMDRLMSDAWATCLTRQRIGSFADLG
jgi:predicted glycoside hydrolase/deacetylase ChbG (UPF0249 family)